MKKESPFFQEEIDAQNQANERDIALRNGSLYEDFIILPARKFLTQQSYCVFSASSSGVLSTTILYGIPGFVRTDENGEYVHISLSDMIERSRDPVLSGLKVGDEVGGLAIDLSSRKRLRVNGAVTQFQGNELVFKVEEAYPNCPKYIQRRTLEFTENTVRSAGPIMEGKGLSQTARDIVRLADTFFVGSINPKGHADVSHRGGNPGFVVIQSDNKLVIPDYKGNSLFNTFGNLLANSSCSLVFWDFDGSRFLHLWGRGVPDMGNGDANVNGGNTDRFWTFEVERFLIQPVVLPFIVSFVDSSPFNPGG